MAENVERWMDGPVDRIPALLQPVAHVLIQAEREVIQLMKDFPPSKLFDRPAGVASASFHLKHITGVLDRLFTYARNEPLTANQLNYLKSEQEQSGEVEVLLQNLSNQVQASLNQLTATNEAILTEFRGVGRKQLPSTVIGLLFHAAEHTMRHTGQLNVTVRILSDPPGIKSL